MKPIKRIDSNKRMSQIVTYGNQFFSSGIVADNTSDSDTASQTSQILNKIDWYLEKVGANKHQIINATIWLANMDDYNEMNYIWDPWVSQENPPARACVEARLASPEYRVEIQITAAI